MPIAEADDGAHSQPMNFWRARSRKGGCLVAGVLLTCVLGYFWWMAMSEMSPPWRGITGEHIYARVDVDCVERVLHGQFGNAVSSSSGDFSDGTSGTVFYYYATSDLSASAQLTVGDPQKNGTYVRHSFLGAGRKIPQEAFAPAMREMRKATDALREGCHLDLSSIRMHEVGQHVDAVH